MASRQVPIPLPWPALRWPAQVLIAIVRWKVQASGSAVPVAAAAARAPVAIRPHVAATTIAATRVAMPAANQPSDEVERRSR
jgi:hypothetical protein